MAYPKEHPILVLGSGPGGLSAAVKLTQLGHRVILADAATQPGGLLRGVQMGPCTVDFGFRMLYNRIDAVQVFLRDVLGDALLSIRYRRGVLWNGHVFDKRMRLQPAPYGVPIALAVRGSLDFLRYRAAHTKTSAGDMEAWAWKRRGPLFSRVFGQVYAEALTGRTWRTQAPPSAQTPEPGLRAAAHPAGGMQQWVDLAFRRFLHNGGTWRPGFEVHRLERLSGTRFAVHARAEGTAQVLHTDQLVLGLPMSVTAQVARPLLDAPQVNAGTPGVPRRTVHALFVLLRKPVRWPHHILEVGNAAAAIHRVTNFSAYPGHMVPPDKGSVCLEAFARNGRTPASPPTAHRLLEEALHNGLFSAEDVLDVRLEWRPHADPGTGWQDYHAHPEWRELHQGLLAMEGLYPVSRPGMDKAMHAGLLAADAIHQRNKHAFTELTAPDQAVAWHPEP